LQGVLYIFDWGLLKIILLDRFHFSEEFGGVILGVSCVMVVLVLHLMHRFAEKISEKLMLTILSFLVAGMLILSMFDIRLIGVVVVLVLCMGSGVMYPFISEIINRHALHDQRATAISVASFLRTLPYVALAPLIGLLNTQGNLGIFLGVWTVLIILAWLIYFVHKRRDTIIKTDF
jgi:predicted MFS family arabinose efflux permease